MYSIPIVVCRSADLSTTKQLIVCLLIHSSQLSNHARQGGVVATSPLHQPLQRNCPYAVGHPITALIMIEMEPDADITVVDADVTEVQPPPPPSRIKSRRVADDGTLTVYSKRSERRRKKQQLKRPKPLDSNLALLDLPFDILIHILTLLRPSDNFRLARTCRPLHTFILEEYPSYIATALIRWRYPCLEKCLRLPVPVSQVPQAYQDALLDEERLREWERDMRRRPYQHIKALDPTSVCRCLTCVLRWNVLCLAVDFAHWQDVLDAHEALPVIPRGRQPEWNSKLLDAHAAVVEKALLPSTSHPSSPLWHAVILETHLDSTVRSIRRHRANIFNKRPHFLMTEEEVVSGTDAFLQRKGPPSVDFPFHRDNYYMLEAYLPNRSWFSETGRWGYMPAEQHDKDIEQMRKWIVWRRELAEKKERAKENGLEQNGHGETTWTMRFTGSDWKPTLVIGAGRGRDEKKWETSSVEKEQQAS